MKLHVEPDELRRVIESAAMVVKRSTSPITECLHIAAEDNRLRVIGTNMDMEAQAVCTAAVTAGGSANVSAADMTRIAKASSGTVELELSDGFLRIESKGMRTALATLNKEFPRLKKPEGHEEVEGVGRVLKALEAFTAREDERFDLAGICLDKGSAVATNSKLFARFMIEGGGGQVMPSLALPVVGKVLARNGRIFVGEWTWRAEAEGLAVMGKLVEAKYPDWRRIQVTAEPFTSFEADEALAALDRATLGRAALTFIELGEGEATMSGEKFGDAHAETRATFRCDGSPAAFAANPADLTKCLKPFAGSVVNLASDGRAFRFSTSERPDDFTMFAAVNDHRTSLPSAKTEAEAA